jgi:hypothetical protein
VLYIKIIYYYILKCEFAIISINCQISFTKLNTAFLIHGTELRRCPVPVQVNAENNVTTKRRQSDLINKHFPKMFKQVTHNGPSKTVSRTV